MTDTRWVGAAAFLIAALLVATPPRGVDAFAQRSTALPVDVSLARSAARQDRQVPRAVVRRHYRQLRKALTAIPGEGFEDVVVLESADAVDALEILRPIGGHGNVPKERHPTL